MTAKSKANLLPQADHLSRLASKLQVKYTHFLRKLQEIGAPLLIALGMLLNLIRAWLEVKLCV